MTKELTITQTENWVKEVVIGCNFCPFAAKELKLKTIHFEVSETNDMEEALMALMEMFYSLDLKPEIETILLIFNNGFKEFEQYLDLVDLAEALLDNQGYEGTYQIASFHPDYTFADTTDDDPANFTNRSPYPTLHILRESSLSKAVDSYPDVDSIPEANIAFARNKGLEYMKRLRDNCFLDFRLSN